MRIPGVGKVYDEITDEVIYLLLSEPHRIGHLVGLTLLSAIHSVWIRYCWDSNLMRALQAHRGSYKTTAIMVVGIIRWWLIHPNDRVVFVRKTTTNAAKVVNTVAQVMDQPIIKEIFKYVHGIYPRAIVRQNGLVTYNFKRTATPEGSLTARGLDSPFTGEHYDKVMGDDLPGPKDRVSKAERERTIYVFRELTTNIIDPEKGSSFTGTPWHPRDVWYYTPVEIRKYPVSVCKILSEAALAEKKLRTTPSLYAANYELNLLSDEGLLFANPTMGKWDKSVPDVVAHLDAAFDGAHYCALTMMARRADGKIQAKGFVYAGNVKDWMATIVNLCRNFNVRELLNEKNPDAGFTADGLRALGLNVTTYSESQNKYVKISTELYGLWPDLVWDENTQFEYMNQVRDFRQGYEPDDAPDSAASLIRERFSKKTFKLWLD